MRPEYATERRIVAVAARQGGVIARSQRLDAGLSAEGVKRRVRAGRLHQIHRGVYAVGHPGLGVTGRRWAAVLAPGSPALGAVLAGYAGERDTRSALEDLIAELCDRHGFAPPQHNVVIAGAVRDFAWPRHRLVAEGDSSTWHRSPTALNSDRERDVTLALAGWRTLRFTYDQVTTRPAYVAGAIRAALSR